MSLTARDIPRSFFHAVFSHLRDTLIGTCDSDLPGNFAVPARNIPYIPNGAFQLSDSCERILTEALTDRICCTSFRSLSKHTKQGVTTS
jgi:hypothetical protein